MKGEVPQILQVKCKKVYYILLKTVLSFLGHFYLHNFFEYSLI